MPMSNRNSGRSEWYVIATKAREERKAKANLERQGYTTFFPTISLKKRRRGRWVTAVEPLFPGYLFVSLLLGADNPTPIRSTAGCVGLVRFGQVHVPVPSGLIAALRKGLVGAAEASLPFQRGDTVRLASGPFAGLNAVFDMPRGDDRAYVLLDLLGQQQRLNVRQDDLK